MAPRKPVKPNRINENKTESKAEVKKELKKEPKRNTSSSTGDEKGFFASVKEFVFDERTRFVAGILILLAVLYVALAFISYFFTGAADQSKLDLPMSELRQMRYEIQNLDIS